MTEKTASGKTVSFSTVFQYGAGGMFSYGFQLVLVGYYINFFMTDILLIPTLTVASLNVYINILKTVSMASAGAIMDAIPIKSGKYRTWYLFCNIALGISLPLTFLYLGMKPSTAAIFFIVMYTIMMISYNTGWTALRTLAGVLGKTSADSVTLGSVSNIAGTMPSIIYPYISPIIFAIPLWAGTNNTFFGFGLISGIIIILGGFLIFNLAKPYEGQAAVVATPKAEKISLIDMIKNLKGPGLAFMISYAFSSAQGGFFSVLLVYYTSYVLKNPTITTSVISFNALAAMIGSFLVPSIAAKFGKKTCQVGYQIVIVILYGVLYLIGNNATLFVAIRALQSFVGCFAMCLLPSFMVDIGDYNEMKGIPAARGFLQSMGGTATRLGSSVSSIFTGFALAFIGYQAGAEVTATMASRITALMILGPAACIAVSCLIIILFYKIDEKELDVYRAKRAAEATVEAK